MNRERIRLGMVGGGKNAFIGHAHRIAAYMCEDYELIGGAFNSSHDDALEFAAELSLDKNRVYADVDQLIKNEHALDVSHRMQVVAVVTPNYLHFEAVQKLLNSGFHVVCEKPMTMTLAEAQELRRLVEETGLNLCLTHTYTGYPMVRQMKVMIANGMIGKVQKVDAKYYQGWVNSFIHGPKNDMPTWRMDPAIAGSSNCMGDIGLHAYNLIEYTTGLQPKELLADLNTLYDDNPLDVDGTVLLRFSDHVKGIVRASQIATGEENNVAIEVYGDKGGLKWEQEDPNYLYYTPEGEPTRVFKPGNGYNEDFTKASTKMVPGHPEGIYDALGNLYKGMAKAIRGEKLDAGEFTSVEDGVNGMQFIERVVESHAEGGTWIKF